MRDVSTTQCQHYHMYGRPEAHPKHTHPMTDSEPLPSSITQKHTYPIDAFRVTRIVTTVPPDVLTQEGSGGSSK